MRIPDPMYWYYLNILTHFCLAAAAAGVIVSFWPSRATYWAAILLFSVVLIALPLLIAFGYLTAVGIAYAFGGTGMPVVALLPPLFILAYFVAAALSLYPFIR